MLMNGFSIKPLKVKLLAGEQPSSSCGFTKPPSVHLARHASWIPQLYPAHQDWSLHHVLGSSSKNFHRCVAGVWSSFFWDTWVYASSLLGRIFAFHGHVWSRSPMKYITPMSRAHPFPTISNPMQKRRALKWVPFGGEEGQPNHFHPFFGLPFGVWARKHRKTKPGGGSVELGSAATELAGCLGVLYGEARNSCQTGTPLLASGKTAAEMNMFSFSPFNFKRNLSLLEKYVFFPGGLKQMEDCPFLVLEGITAYHYWVYVFFSGAQANGRFQSRKD